jgi:hypothetical protein
MQSTNQHLIKMKAQSYVIVDGVFSSIDLLVLFALLCVHLHTTFLFKVEQSEITRGKILSKRVRTITSLGDTLVIGVLMIAIISNFILTFYHSSTNKKVMTVLYMTQELGGIIIPNCILLTLARIHCVSIINLVRDLVARKREVATKVSIALFVIEMMLTTSAVVPKIIVDIRYYTEAVNSVMLPKSTIFVVKQIFDRYFDLTLAINTFCLIVVTVWFSGIFIRSNSSERRKPFLQSAAMVLAFVFYMSIRMILVYAKLGVDLRDRSIITEQSTRMWWFHCTVISECILFFIHWCMIGPVTTQRQVVKDDVMLIENQPEELSVA